MADYEISAEQSTIDIMARAAYEAQRERLTPDVELQPWDEEPEALREDWRQFMRDGLEAIGIKVPQPA